MALLQLSGDEHRLMPLSTIVDPIGRENMNGHAIRQVAYFVSDMREAARQHSALFGTGPFFVVDSLPLENCVHRGVPRYLDHGTCIAQWGEVMLEFNQQNMPGPSYFHDLYPEGSGRYGFHHVALIVDDLAASKAAFVASGLEIAFEADGMGMSFAMIDAIERHGHFIEIYEKLPGVEAIYQMVKDMAGQFEGDDVFRRFPMADANGVL
ncbi:Glyoxalase/Bleomycin resistance protein/Dioxygenase superfamily protein [Sphingobium faniae]|nr:Glyoxalase/Bleomycin resistance protein/Dioxygenase superfamily protein [Sphingobium faniae]